MRRGGFGHDSGALRALDSARNASAGMRREPRRLESELRTPRGEGAPLQSRRLPLDGRRYFGAGAEESLSIDHPLGV